MSITVAADGTWNNLFASLALVRLTGRQAWKLLLKSIVRMPRERPCLLVCVTLGLIACFASRVWATIDFTPTTGERNLEGIVFKQLIFHEDGHAITYEPPRGWTYFGNGTRFRLTPADFGQAQAEITQAALVEPQIFDESTKKNLQTQVLAAVPQGGQNILVIPESGDSLNINGQATFVVTVGYTQFGQDYRLSAMFMNHAKTQLQFRVIAKKKDFDQVNRLFRGSLFSLQWH